MDPAVPLPVDVSAAKSMPTEMRCFSGTGWATDCLCAMLRAVPHRNLSCSARSSHQYLPSNLRSTNVCGLSNDSTTATFLTVRNVVRLPGRQPRISLISDYTGGTRLSEVLVRADADGKVDI